MKIKNKLLIISILAITYLFAQSSSSISELIETINYSTNLKEKNILMAELNEKLLMMKNKELKIAQDTIMEKLILSRIPEINFTDLRK